MARRQRWKRRRAPVGVAFAFLALAIQVLLPFVVAAEIDLLGNPAYASAPICSASLHEQQPGQQSDHGLGTTCPLCLTLAASHGFTGASSAALPLPQGDGVAVDQIISPWQSATPVAASYNSRAPPVIA